MKIKKHLAALLLILPHLCAHAQWANPVSFSTEQKRTSENQIVLTFKGTIESGWHVYSTDNNNGGPTPATFNIDIADGITPVGKLQPLGKPQRKFEEIFGMEVTYFENQCAFRQMFTINKKEYQLKGYLEYGACDDQNCIPPTPFEITIKGNDGPAASTNETAVLPISTQSADTLAVALPTNAIDTLATDAPLWSDVTKRINSPTNQHAAEEQGKTTLWWLFFMGLTGGLLALFTPCVWPIIPMTVSLFLKRSEKRSRGIRDALIYGLSIITIYVSLGTLVTLVFGAAALNALSTNAIVNIFFFLLLVAFGISFLGVFEISLPSSWSNKADQKASATSGMVSLFIMALTLSLVSLACAGPIIGFMLVEIATTGSLVGPVIAMLGFSVALALPFTLFALFPTMLKKAPKSGGWMNTFKVFLGFVELAFAFKFLSVADLSYGWHILDREIFLIFWILLSVLAALYFLGVIKLPIDHGRKNKPDALRITLGLASLAFAIYMVPGVLGKPLPAISAFAPPMHTQHIRLFSQTVEPQFRDYEEGMRHAQKVGKPVLLDFTGYGCVNCREMEQKVWNDPRVADLLKNKVILISLYVDGKTSLPERMTVVENGRTTTLRTQGDKWSYLQRKRFGANAQPFYVVCSPDGLPLSSPYGFDTDPDNFINFINSALKQ